MLKEKVQERHKRIANLFNSGVGLHAQFIDSQIAERVMRKMMDVDILVLPIHDSFIVSAGYEQMISVVKEEAFYEITNGRAGVEADGPRLRRHFGMNNEQFDEEVQRLE